MRLNNLPRYVYADRDRHGNVRLYFMRRGLPKIRFKHRPGSDDFARAYALALVGGQLPAAPARVSAEGSLEWLCRLYFQSAEFKGWEIATRNTKRNVLRQICREPLNADTTNGPTFGDMPAADMPSKALRVLRDRWAATPAHANNMLAIITRLYQWGIDEEHVTLNPAREVKRLKIESEGFHTWTEAELAIFETKYPIGTQQRLAFAIFAFTGVRISDAVTLGPQHWVETENGPRFVIKTQKTNYQLNVPVLPELASIITATVHGERNYLIRDTGENWKLGGFRWAFKKWCLDAGLPHCSAHGIRKAAACRAAEGGATEAQMMAVFGWENSKQATRYIRKANRGKMAGAAMDLLKR